MKKILKIVIPMIIVTFILVLTGLFIFSKPSSAVTASDWQADNIIDDGAFTNSGAMSVQDIQDFLNKQIGNCDVNGTQPASEYGRPDITHAQYAASQGWPGPAYTCLNLYHEVPKINPGGDMPANNYSNPNVIPAGAQSAAWIIKDAAVRYNISPKVLLVKIATESAGPLTSDKWPLFTQYKYAMGSHCPDSGPGGAANCDPSYAGFSIQMYSAAQLMRSYLDGMTQSWWTYKRPGGGVDIARNSQYKDLCSSRMGVQNSNCVGWAVPASCGGTVINIKSKGTAALYTYTPYQPNQASLNAYPKTGDGCSQYGNRNFWWKFNDWFGSSKTNIPYSWQYVTQEAYQNPERTVKFTSTPTTHPGGKVFVSVKALNVGYQTWQQNAVRMAASRPIDSPSVFASSAWISNTRAVSLKESSVPPGQVGTFEFELQSPNDFGEYKAYFNILNEGIVWFNDPGLYFTVNVNSTVTPSSQVNPSLSSGESLQLGQNLLSPDKHSVLAIERNGNLSLLSNFKSVWSISSGSVQNTKLAMQTDGNLVLYSSTGVPLWSTQTQGNPGAYIIIQTDGNLVLYSSAGVPLWATYTLHIPEHLSYVNTTLPIGFMYPFQELETPDRKYKLILQPDGNLVLYTQQGKALWASGTDGKGVSFLALQEDGHLVLYDNKYSPIWYSRTSGSAARKVILQQDGNLVLYTNDLKPVWATYTNR